MGGSLAFLASPKSICNRESQVRNGNGKKRTKLSLWGIATHQLDVEKLVNHDILRLQVPVHDLQLLQVLQDVYKLGRVVAHQPDVKLPYVTSQVVSF